jgi:hypothetical protein
MFTLIYQKQQSEYFISESLVASDYVLCDGVCVAEFLLDIPRVFNGLTHLLKSARLKSDANSLIELLVLVASLEHLVNDALHLRINNDSLFLFVNNSDSLFDILIDTLMDEGLNIL